MNKNALFAILIGYTICTSAYGVTCPILYYTPSGNYSKYNWGETETENTICSAEPVYDAASSRNNCEYNDMTINDSPVSMCGDNVVRIRLSQSILGDGLPEYMCAKNRIDCKTDGTRHTGHKYNMDAQRATGIQDGDAVAWSPCYIHTCANENYYFYPYTESQEHLCATYSSTYGTTDADYGTCESIPRQCNQSATMVNACTNVGGSSATLSGRYTYTSYGYGSGYPGSYDYSNCYCSGRNGTYSGWNGTTWTYSDINCDSFPNIQAACPNDSTLNGRITTDLSTNETTNTCACTNDILIKNGWYYTAYTNGAFQGDDWIWGTVTYTLNGCSGGYYRPSDTPNRFENVEPTGCSPVGRGYYSVTDDNNLNRNACPIGATTDTDTSISINDCHLTGATIFSDKNGSFSISNLDAQLAK